MSVAPRHAPNDHSLDVVRRESDGTWSRHISGIGHSARLMSIACDLAIAEVYRDPFAND